MEEDNKKILKKYEQLKDEFKEKAQKEASRLKKLEKSVAALEEEVRQKESERNDLIKINQKMKVNIAELQEDRDKFFQQIKMLQQENNDL